MKLAALQELFWQSVRAQRAPEAVRAEFVSHASLGAVRRMQIYRSAYWRRHELCLQESYPRLLSLLGEAGFRTLVAAYIERHPSTQPAIEWAGREMSVFLKWQPKTSTLVAPHLPDVLSGLAAVEWARLQVRLERDAQAFDRSRLSDAQVADAKVHLSPALCVVEVPHAAWRLSQESSSELAVEPNAEPNAEPNLELDPVWLVVWRGRGGVKEQRVDREQGRALTRASRQETLAAVCSEFAEPEATERAMAAFGQWMSRGWIERLEQSQ